MKKLRVMVLTFLSMLVLSSFSLASGDISIVVNDAEISTDVAPAVMNGRTLVPARAVFENMGAEVGWNSQTKAVTVKLNQAEVKLTLGSRVAKVNGTNICLDQPAMAVNGRTLVPVRFISESLGAKVGWNGDTSTVTIETNENLGLGKPKSSSGAAVLGQEMVMRATAYGDSAAENGGWAGLTSLGTKLRPGVVAVDRSVIPLGTKLYIEYADGTPYGFVVAEDTGGAIKGNKIDIFMDSSLVRSFGVKSMKVYVVK